MRKLVLVAVMLATLVAGTVASGNVAVAPELRLSEFRVAVEFVGMPPAFFRSVSGLSFEVEVVEFREGGSSGFATRKLQGVTKWPNIVLKQGYVGSHSELLRWAHRVATGQTERRNGTIVVYDEKLTVLARYRFVNAWPTKWEGPELDASKNEIALETLEIVHEGWSLD